MGTLADVVYKLASSTNFWLGDGKVKYSDSTETVIVRGTERYWPGLGVDSGDSIWVVSVKGVDAAGAVGGDGLSGAAVDSASGVGA